VRAPGTQTRRRACAGDQETTLRNPRAFDKSLAIGAPEPVREIPFKPSRMIHFLDLSNEKMVEKVPAIAPTVDILLGNLEDAVSVDRKEAARAGLIKVGREMDMGETALWTRVNSLESPWVLDDLTEIVGAIGDRIEVIMVPKVEGPWDIHYVDRLLAQLEAKAGIEKPILVHAILETALGVANLEEIAAASPRIQGMSFGPADLAASRRMKTTRVGGGHPGYRTIADPDADEVIFAKKVIEAIPDGRGVHMIDGKMQDDATWKQCQVMVKLAEMLARKDPELAEAYGFVGAEA
jgi:malyl-CoA/(S)-citramalyl-CoA lyase